ncbi:Prefoldin subunit 5 [Chionoecetes opilio]|uniref:Prefoldin subunit 5 n=1 Tax=Chionoecetes opilio TaxID=41210 RepID=A0A8J5D473_CHIOP|nr:Prefoldin subunit 5 [Chionoecetes opilio]
MELQFFSESLQQLKIAQLKFNESGECVEKLTPETKGQEILVPLTSCMYVPGTVANSEKLLIEVGTGYYIERDVPGAKDYFSRKIKFVTEQMEKIQKIASEKSKLREVAVSNQFNVLGALEDPVELWDTFKRETLQAAKECIGERPRSRRGFVSTKMLENVEESRAARLDGNQDQHRTIVTPDKNPPGERQEECYFEELLNGSWPQRGHDQRIAWCPDCRVAIRDLSSLEFTPGKSTTDRILALRVLVERRREFQQGMLAAYVDLKKVFHSVHLVMDMMEMKLDQQLAVIQQQQAAGGKMGDGLVAA